MPHNSKRAPAIKKDIDGMSKDELRELLLINTYKLALTRAQLDAVVEILIKERLTSYKEIWKRTNEIFEQNKKG